MTYNVFSGTLNPTHFVPFPNLNVLDAISTGMWRANLCSNIFQFLTMSNGQLAHVDLYNGHKMVVCVCVCLSE